MTLGIAACFGYLDRVPAVAGAEQCFALLPIHLPDALSYLQNSHYISLSIIFSFHVSISLFLKHDVVNY